MSPNTHRASDDELHDVLEGYETLIRSPRVTLRQARELHTATIRYRIFGYEADGLTNECRIRAIRAAVEELMTELDGQKTLAQ